MLALLFLSVGADPAFEVTNKCPPSFTVVNRCPAPAAKPVKAPKNGLNCRAPFCGAQGGGVGCAAMGQNCPNSAGGQCVCGAKTAAPAPTFGYTLPSMSYQVCPTGN